MIIKEFYGTKKDGTKLYKTYSDLNFKIKQVETGILYDEAIDVENSNFTYVKTNIPIEEEIESEE